MQYKGSKRRIASLLLPIILEGHTPDTWYVEPFVGGFNMMDKVSGKRLANDAFTPLIDLYKALQEGWEPPANGISEEDYLSIKANPANYPKPLVAFAGFCCTYGANYMGSYAKNDRKGKFVNRSQQAGNALKRQVKAMKGVIFTNTDYLDLKLPSESCTIYCDPPYLGTSGYGQVFNHELFWEWVRNLSSQGHKVFISEYQAPPDFSCIKEVELLNGFDPLNKKKQTEKLFTLLRC